MSDKPRCSVDGCERVHRARGLCGPHYEGLRIRGLLPIAPPRERSRSRAPQYQALLEMLRGANTDDCILWCHGTNRDGYGQVWTGSRTQLTHVVACELTHGPRPPGLEAAHSCNTPPCFNPRHLRWDTHVGNMVDMYKNGTHPAKLTEEQVRSARRRVRDGETRAAVAVSLGVTRSTISSVVSRRWWAWVEDD